MATLAGGTVSARQRPLLDGNQAHSREQLVGLIKQPLPQGQPAQLEAQQPACEMLIEAAKLPHNRGRLWFAQQQPPECAGVEVDAGQAQRRSRRLSAR